MEVNKDLEFYLTDNTKLIPNYDLSRPYISNMFMGLKPSMETTVINSSGMDLVMVDNYGVASRLYKTPLDQNLASALGVGIGFKGVFIIEKKVLDKHDITYNFSSTYDRYSTVGIRGLAIENYLRESDGLTSLYKVHIIRYEQIVRYRCIEINVSNITISLPGYSKVHSAVKEERCELKISKEHKAIIGSNISYYSDEQSHVYINIMNNILRIDSLPVEDRLKGSGVKMVYEDGGVKKVIFIPESEFKQHNIFYSSREAEKNMNKKELIEDKKLDVDYYKAETSMLSSATDRLLMNSRVRVELLNNSMKLNFERHKMYTALKKTDDRLDKAKKVTDIISMIFKIL